MKTILESIPAPLRADIKSEHDVDVQVTVDGLEPLAKAITSFGQSLDAAADNLDPFALKEIFRAYRAELDKNANLGDALRKAEAEMSRQLDSNRPRYKVTFKASRNANVRIAYKDRHGKTRVPVQRGLFEAPYKESFYLTVREASAAPDLIKFTIRYEVDHDESCDAEVKLYEIGSGGVERLLQTRGEYLKKGAIKNFDPIEVTNRVTHPENEAVEANAPR